MKGFGLQPRPPLTGVSQALLARNPERVSKESPGAGRPRGPKSVRNSLEPVCFGQFLDSGGDSFETLSGFRAWRARETPVRAWRGCKFW